MINISDITVPVLLTILCMLMSFSIVVQCKSIKQNKANTDEMSAAEKIKYTTDMIDFIKVLCQQTSLLRFRDFIDNHEISKTTRSNYAAIVDETARSIHNSLMRTNIRYDDLLVSQEYVNTYIIEVTSITIRDLLEKTIEGELDNH